MFLPDSIHQRLHAIWVYINILSTEMWNTLHVTPQVDFKGHWHGMEYMSSHKNLFGTCKVRNSHITRIKITNTNILNLNYWIALWKLKLYINKILQIVNINWEKHEYQNWYIIFNYVSSKSYKTMWVSQSNPASKKTTSKPPNLPARLPNQRSITACYCPKVARGKSLRKLSRASDIVGPTKTMYNCKIIN